MKRKINLSIFWIFTIALTGTVILFGVINLFIINHSLKDIIVQDINQHGKIIATSLAERSIDPIAYDDLGTLDKIVSDEKRIDTNIAYILILDNHNKVLAHTFYDKVPAELLTANTINKDRESNIVRIQLINNPETIIRDMIIPVLDGNLGYVRIGFYEKSFFTSVKKISRIFLLMMLLFLILGIFGAFFFSYLITTPIKHISKIAKSIDLESLELNSGIFDLNENQSKLLKLKKLIPVNDEIDVLIDSFGKMVNRLQKAYSELQVAQESLLQTEKMSALGTLSMGLAHEINNPITGIQNCLRRIKESPDNMKQNVLYIEMTENAVNRIEKVVKNLLDLSRTPDLKFLRINLINLIENVLLLSSYQLEKSRIAILQKYEKKQVFLYASPNHIEQVLLNLVLNSIDAIEEKKLSYSDYKGKIQFSVRQNLNMTTIEIEDNGIGIAEEKLKNLFDPFFTQKKIKQGTGLGLSVSYNIIQQHNGMINCHINSFGGLTFKISLPNNINNANDGKQ